MKKDFDLDILKKALLYECGHLLEKAKGNALNDSKVFNRVTSFYTQLRNKFTFEINLSCDISRGFDEAEKDIKMKVDWLDSNGIVHYVEHGAFYFSNEEDATAFKLRWE